MRRNPVLIGLATASLLAGCAHIAPPTRHPSSAAGASGSSATSALRPGALKNPPPQTRILWANCNAPPHAGPHCGAPPYPSQGWNFTNYLVSPENDVIAGAPTASPSKGAFILTDGSGAGMHFLPPGTGVPTITKWDPPDTLHFTTSSGASGTVNVRTGKITLLRTPAPSSVHSPRGVRRQPLSLLSVAMTGSHRGYALAATKQGGRARSVVTTSDGGVHWRTALRLSYNAREIVAPDATHAYLVADCVRPGCAGSVIMATDDGGRSWTTVETARGVLSSLSFVSATQGWALAGETNPLQQSGAQGAALLHTTDGGKTWTSLADPCKGGGVLSFANARVGWMSCLSGQPGAGLSSKVVFRTRDGGKKWTVVAATGPVPRSSPAPSGLPRVGYVHTLFFSNHRDGWIGIDRGGYWSTTDGGATWKYAWSSSFRIGTDHAPSVGMLPSGFGWALEDNPGYGNTDQATTALYTTIDNGAHWREVYPLTTPTAHSGLPTGAREAPASPAPPRPSSTR